MSEKITKLEDMIPLTAGHIAGIEASRFLDAGKALMLIKTCADTMVREVKDGQDYALRCLWVVKSSGGGYYRIWGYQWEKPSPDSHVWQQHVIGDMFGKGIPAGSLLKAGEKIEEYLKSFQTVAELWLSG